MLFERLSNDEINMIDSYRREYGEGSYYAHTSPAPVKDMLREWDCAKEEMYHLLGDNLIIKREVEFTENEGRIFDKLSSDPAITQFRINFNECVAHGGHPELIGHRYDLMNLVSYDFLARNRYGEIPFEVQIPNEKHPYKIAEGCKVIKALGHFAEAYDIPGFEEFRIAHSMIFNQKKLKGNLCLSIHPLDFMTMSDNASDWTSCMSWVEEGEYHLGTIEMMNSPCVIEAYLESSNPMTIDGHPWSNKKWRSLYVINNKIITEIKGYPYQSDEMSNNVLEWLRELVKTNFGWEQFTGEITTHDGHRTQNNDFKMTFNFQTYYMYNDFGCKDHHQCLIGEDDHENHKIRYSGQPTCVWCGGLIDTNSDHSTDCLLCGNCSDEANGQYCSCCEERIRGEIWWIGDEPLCESCYDNETSEDTLTGDRVWNNDLINLYLMVKANKEETCNYLENLSDEDKVKFFKGAETLAIETANPDNGVGKYYKGYETLDKPIKNWWGTNYRHEEFPVVFMEDLTERGKELFYREADAYTNTDTPCWEYPSAEDWFKDNI